MGAGHDAARRADPNRGVAGGLEGLVSAAGVRGLMDALVMAGGLGTRLRPLTFSLPKPLLPVGGQPILEILLRQLRRQGFTRVFVSVGHKGHLVRSYLNELALDGVAVSCVAEDTPLGTAGALRLLPDDVADVFVINGDILT